MGLCELTLPFPFFNFVSMTRTAPGEKNLFPVTGATGVYKGAK